MMRALLMLVALAAGCGQQARQAPLDMHGPRRGAIIIPQPGRPVTNAAALPSVPPLRGDLLADQATNQLAYVSNGYWREAGSIVGPIPSVIGYTPSFAPHAASVTINGSGFTPAADLVVKFNGVSATIVSSSSAAINTTVPVTATTGTVTVANQAGTGTGPIFVVTGAIPAITALSASSGTPGQTITLTGSGFTGATAVTFPGAAAAASFNVATDSSATAVVPNTNDAAGNITITTAGGTSTALAANAFTLNNFKLPLNATALPPDVAAKNTSVPLLWLQTNASTLVQQTACSNCDIMEDRGDGLGPLHWALVSYTNSITNPDDWSTGWTNSNVTVTTNTGTGPDGVANNTMRVVDSSASTDGYAQLLLVPGGVPAGTEVVSIWTINDAGNPPSGATGAFFAVDNTDLSTGNAPVVALGGLSTWTRTTAFWTTNAGHSGIAGTAYVSGQTPNNNVLTLAGGLMHTVTATGGIYVAKPMIVDPSIYDPPHVKGSAGAVPNASYQVGSAVLGQIYNSSTELHVLVDMVSDRVVAQSQTAAVWPFTINTGGGLHGVWWQNNVFTMRVNGTDTLSITTGAPPQSVHWGVGTQTESLPMRLEMVARNTGQALNVWINGCSNGSSNSNATATTLSTPTDAWIGSNLGSTGFTPNRFGNVIKTSLDENRAEFLVLGASEEAVLNTNNPAMCTYIYKGTEAWTRTGMRSFAVAGEYVSQQQARFDGFVNRASSQIKAVMIMGDVIFNDVVTNGHIAIQTEAALQALVTDIRTTNATPYILVYPMTPCGTYSGVTAAQLTQIDAVNTWLTTPGNLTDTGNKLIIGPLWTALSTGGSGTASSTLLASEESALGDHLHYGPHARQTVVAPRVRSDLHSVSLLP